MDFKISTLEALFTHYYYGLCRRAVVSQAGTGALGRAYRLHRYILYTPMRFHTVHICPYPDDGGNTFLLNFGTIY